MTGERDLPDLRWVAVSGEQLVIGDRVRRFFQQRPGARLMNLYGPTSRRCRRKAASQPFPVKRHELVDALRDGVRRRAAASRAERSTAPPAMAPASGSASRSRTLVGGHHGRPETFPATSDRGARQEAVAHDGERILVSGQAVDDLAVQARGRRPAVGEVRQGVPGDPVVEPVGVEPAKKTNCLVSISLRPHLARRTDVARGEAARGLSLPYRSFGAVSGVTIPGMRVAHIVSIRVRRS